MLAFLIQVQFIVSGNFGDELNLRKINNKGPTAWKSGASCLQIVGDAYFPSRKNITRPEILTLTHITNMSSPAAEIEDLYRRKQHQNAACINCIQSGYQSLIVSNTLDESNIFVRDNVSQNALVTSDFYVIVADDLDRLEYFLTNYLSRTINWNPGAKFLILYVNADQYDSVDNTVQEIFSYLLDEFYVSKVMLLFAVNVTSYEVMRLNYFGTNTCRSAQVKKLASCHRGLLSDLDFKTIQFDQVQKRLLTDCTFKACCKIAEPFVESNCQNGLELDLVEVIRKKIGFDLNLNCSTIERGILQNDSWTGLLHRLDSRDCDFIMGGFYPDDDVRNYFWVTHPYLRDSYTWFVGNAPLQPAWKGLISIFATETWWLILVVLAITWITWFTIANINRENSDHRSISLTALNNLGVVLGVSVNERPRLPPLRLFFIGLILFGLNITSLYTSNLIAVFTNPKKDDQISTIKEILKRKLPFGGPKENKDWFYESDNTIYKGYNDSDEFDSNLDSLKRVADHKQALLANRMFVLQSNYSDRVYGFRDDVFLSPLQMIVGRGFPLLHDFNAIIVIMMDMGFFNKINIDFNYNNTILKYIRKLKISDEKIITLRLDHLGGAFAILLVGLGFSVTVFILELITHLSRYKSLKNQHSHRLLWEDYYTITTRNRQYSRKKSFQQIPFTTLNRRKVKNKSKDQ